MIWTAAILLAFQTAAAGPAAQPSLTPQQKQALAQYNFKGATAALNGQNTQPSKAGTPLAPIPLLQIPPIAGRATSASPSGSVKATQSGSEVPTGWKPPHAELGSTGASALAVAREVDSSVSTPTPGSDGRVIYTFGQGTAVLVCAPLRVCAIELQAGEHLQSQPQIGDSRRWEITPILSGSGLEEEPILVVKPIEPGLETDLIIPPIGGHMS